MSRELIALAERVEKACEAFAALGYTAQFNTIADATRREANGIGVSPARFVESLTNQAAALRARAAQNQAGE